MSDVGPETENMQRGAAEVADARVERRKWGPKFWKRLGLAGAALITAAALPAVLPGVAGWLAAPLVHLGVPGISSAAVASGAGSAVLAGEAAAKIGFVANWLAPALNVAGGIGLLTAIRPGIKYGAAIAK